MGEVAHIEVSGRRKEIKHYFTRSVFNNYNTNS